jgi:hypothetical protein
MSYINYRLHLTEAGAADTEQVKQRLLAMVDADAFAYLKTDTHTAVLGTEAQTKTVLTAGVALTPGTKTALIDGVRFTEVAKQVEGVTRAERVAGA